VKDNQFMEKMKTTHRQLNVEAGRVMMAFLVVALHTLPSSYPQLQMLCRCAVPFFLITSGYFLKIPESTKFNLAKKSIFKLIPIYIFWLIVYYTYAFLTNTHPLLISLKDLISGGTAFHLWYLPAAVFSIIIIGYGIGFLGFNLMIFVCLVLFCLAVVQGSYHDVLNLSGQARRGGIFAAPAFVMAGYFLSRNGKRSNPYQGWIFLISGIVTIALEEHFIAYETGHTLQSHDFTFGTFFFGYGAFLIFSKMNFGFIVQKLHHYGRYSFGIYLTHILIIWTGSMLTPAHPLSFVILIPCFFALALLLSMLISKVPYLNRTIN
jgi:surface polysaccharide O-acyltransferase-like enzyme